MRLIVGNTQIDISIEEIRELNSIMDSESPIISTIVRIFDKALEIIAPPASLFIPSSKIIYS